MEPKTLQEVLDRTKGEPAPAYRQTILRQPAETARTEFRLRGHLKEIAELAEAARVETYLDNPAGVANAVRKMRSILDEAGAAFDAWQAALAEKSNRKNAQIADRATASPLSV